MGHYEINKNLAQSVFDCDIYSNMNPIDMVKIHYGADNEKDKVAVFTTDFVWRRIVYSQKNSTELKAISSEEIGGGLMPLAGITTETNWQYDNYIYTVSQTPDSKVCRFQYQPSINQLILHSKFSVYGALDLHDISYKQGGSGELWLADLSGGIFVCEKNGAIKRTITQFYSGSTAIPISHITRLEVSNTGNQLVGFIDKFQQRMVIAKWENNKLNAITMIELTAASRLTDVGINYDSEFYFTDESLNCLYKFNELGEYICTLNDPAWFKYPSRLTNIAWDRPSMPAIEFYVANRWTSENGIRRYLLGSDVVDITANQAGLSYLNLNYRLMGDSYVKIDILKNGVLKYTKTYGWQQSGLRTEVVNFNTLGIDRKSVV